MSIDIRPFTRDDSDRLAAVVRHPSLVREFEVLQRPQGIAELMDEPFIPTDLRWIAEDRGAPVGFAFSFLLQGLEGKWSMMRIGVIDSARRRRLGTRLFETARDGLRRHDPGCEICTTAWLPNEAADAFARRHGFQRVRTYWLMERPGMTPPVIVWPRGIETRIFDGSDGMIEDWNRVYNRSFARHYHFAVTTVDDERAIAARTGFEASGLLLAYRDGRCVGFCRNQLFGHRGEIGILGTDPDARGIGLGRALLRWGVNWLLEHRSARVTLTVEGENETALGLYRSEGFEIADTRAIWSLAG